MSTKAHIFMNNSIEAYHETSEPQMDFFGKHQGFNIYLFINHEHGNNIEIEDGMVKIKQNTELMPKEIKLPAWDMVRFESDFEGILLVIKGGSLSAKEIEKLKS